MPNRVPAGLAGRTSPSGARAGRCRAETAATLARARPAQPPAHLRRHAAPPAPPAARDSALSVRAACPTHARRTTSSTVVRNVFTRAYLGSCDPHTRRWRAWHRVANAVPGAPDPRPPAAGPAREPHPPSASFAPPLRAFETGRRGGTWMQRHRADRRTCAHLRVAQHALELATALQQQAVTQCALHTSKGPHT